MSSCNVSPFENYRPYQLWYLHEIKIEDPQFRRPRGHCFNHKLANSALNHRANYMPLNSVLMVYEATGGLESAAATAESVDKWSRFIGDLWK